MPSQGARTAMLLGSALVATIAGSAPASSQDLVNSGQLGTKVNFALTAEHEATEPFVELNLNDNGGARFSELNQTTDSLKPSDRRALELELGASHDLTGIPLDFAIAQRASFEAGDDGEINRHSRGSEVRIGRALGDPQDNGGGMSSSESRIYVFAASDDEALTWRPGQQSNRFAYETDRVEIGDRQAGVTYQRGRVQASIAYVEREISAQVGTTSASDNEQFTGFTLTMRH